MGEAKSGAGSTEDEPIKVLVVDDEPEILELVAPALRDQGYLVYEAENGDEAIDVIREFRPVVVVLDVMMPGLSGWEVCRMVRFDPDLEGVRIIMATGIGDVANAANSLLYGADDALDKPFRLDVLVQKVGALVDRTLGRSPSSS